MSVLCVCQQPAVELAGRIDPVELVVGQIAEQIAIGVIKVAAEVHFAEVAAAVAGLLQDRANGRRRTPEFTISRCLTLGD